MLDGTLMSLHHFWCVTDMAFIEGLSRINFFAHFCVLLSVKAPCALMHSKYEAFSLIKFNLTFEPCWPVGTYEVMHEQ